MSLLTSLLAPGDGTHPWRQEVNVLVPSDQSAGWNAPQMSSTVFFNNYLSSDSAQGRWVEYDVVLGAGTWSLTLFHQENNERGIYSVTLDGSAAGSIDGYAASAAAAVDTISNITVTTGGKKTIRLALDTKNASSTGHVGLISWITLVRTA